MTIITRATGDKLDMLGRLRALLPRWFNDSAVLVTAVLQGYASAAAFVYGLYVYAKMQTRISTATEGWLDMIAADYFGSSVTRKAGQSDDSFRTVILGNLLRERATHEAMVKALTDLTGRVPRVVELRRPLDTGAYGYLYGYGVRGAYGSAWQGPYQAFVTAYRPLGGSGYAATDTEIYATVDAVKPAGTVIWTAISN
jgi:hypothetical protein